MHRRDVVKSLGMISMHALYPSVLASFIASCKQSNPQKDFSFFESNDVGAVTAVIDIILPKTKTKSASESGVQFFLDDVFATCLTTEQKALIKSGISTLTQEWNRSQDKLGLVKTLDEKAYAGDEASAWFKPFKQYTVIGFFTSQEGTTKAGDYQKIPEKYIGEIEVNDATLAHSNTTLRFYL